MVLWLQTDTQVNLQLTGQGPNDFTGLPCHRNGEFTGKQIILWDYNPKINFLFAHQVMTNPLPVTQITLVMTEIIMNLFHFEGQIILPLKP
ncbi:hypothetical protein AV530_018149 [Patagioenas fasciata monilis]|uniref:Uncharacterized protein n=1 Tax=Patagioenas fasciata monilis TaxID=372326 RepID=A0A1V4KKY9_PATFA|nr:hypothetical protein AV530_018149 [Patagioenas fasciata monilis]